MSVHVHILVGEVRDEASAPREKSPALHRCDTQRAREDYVYDIAGRRIRVVRLQGVEQYFQFGLNPVLVLEVAGNVLGRKLHGLGTDEFYA